MDDTEISVIKAVGRPFPKGQSGNPAGRPRVVQEFRQRARRAVDKYVLDRWKHEVMTEGPAWVRCSELLAAYAYGKPPRAPAHEVCESPPRVFALAVTEAELP